MSRVPFICSKCGAELQLRVSQEAKSLEDLIGAPCAQCGHPLAEDDVKQQALKIAEDRIKKALKGL